MIRNRLENTPAGEPVPVKERNVTLYSYTRGYNFCGYRAAMQHKGKNYCRYFSAKKLGWQGAYDAAVKRAKAWRKAFGKKEVCRG